MLRYQLPYFLVLLFAAGCSGLLTQKHTALMFANTATTTEKNLAQEKEAQKIMQAIVTLRPKIKPETAHHYAQIIVQEAKQYEIDPWLVVAVMAQESRFRTYAKSHAGALGLMQVLPRVGYDVAKRHKLTWAGRQTLYQPEHNIKIGIIYLTELLTHFQGNLHTALLAYNAGPTRIRQRIEQGWTPQGQYARKVVAMYKLLSQPTSVSLAFASNS